MKSKHKVTYICYFPILGLLFVISLLYLIIHLVIIIGLMLLILIFSLIGDIKKNQFKKRKETDSLYSSLIAKDPQIIWSSLSLITAILLFLALFIFFFNQGDISLAFFMFFPLGLMVFIGFMMRVDKKQKERQKQEDEKRDILKNDTKKEIIRVYDSINKVNVYFAFDGKGTKEDSFIVSPSNNLPQSFDLSGDLFNPADTYYIIKNLRNENVSLYNLSVELNDCVFSKLKLYRCPNSAIKQSNIKKKVSIFGCEKITIDSCNISTLKLKYSYENLFKSNTIDQIKNIRSRANNFENNHIPDKQIQELYKRKRISLVTKITIPCVSLLMIILFVVYILPSFNNNPSKGMLFIFILILFNIITAICLIQNDIKSARKLEDQYPPNY